MFVILNLIQYPVFVGHCEQSEAIQKILNREYWKYKKQPFTKKYTPKNPIQSEIE